MNHLPGVCSMVAAFILPHSSFPGEPCPPQRLGLGENQAAEGDGAVAQELAAQLRPGNVHSAEGGEESATSRRKPGEASRGDGEVSAKIAWETDQGAGWLHPEGAHLAARRRAGV